MEKTLRLIGLVAVLGAVAMVAAQVASTQDGVRTKSARSDTGQAVASGPGGLRLEARTNQHPGPHAYAEPNVIQKVMNLAFTGKHNYYIEQASAAGKESLVSQIILVNCHTALTLMRPDEQLHEMHDVWQVDVWVPKDTRWAAVCKAPSLVKELLDVDPSVQSKVQTEWDRSTAEGMAANNGLVARLNQNPAFAGKSREEQIQIIHTENAKLYAGKSKVDLSAESAKRCGHMLAFIRANLKTKAQVDEFDRFTNRFDQGMAEVLQGRTPSFLRN